MKTNSKKAFTLVESLVVITIIALLLVLLIPSLSNAWQYSQLTRCKHNLNAIYTGYGAWRADRTGRGSDTRLTGMAWRGQLVGYLEESRQVFTCGSRWRPDYAVQLANQKEQDWTGNEFDKDKALADRLANNVGGAKNGWAAGSYVSSGPEPDDWAFEFDIYLQFGAIEGNTGVNGAGVTGQYGAFIRSISLGSTLVNKSEKENGVMRFEADDCGIGITGDADITADIKFENNRPVSVTPIKGSGAGTHSATGRYIYDFKICGKVLVPRWQTRYGETVLIKDALSPDESWRVGGEWGTDEGVADSWVAPLMGDYGLSRGSYETVNKTIQVPDGKQFFILDYPRPLADYLACGNIGDTLDQNSYFVEDPRTWDVTKGPMAQSKPDKPWNYWQSLRHFGKANVLFCDGHVELVSGPNGATLDDIYQFRWLGNIDSRQSDREQVSALQSKLNKDFGIDQGFSPLWIKTNK